MKTDIICLQQLRPYMQWYGFTRMTVARALITYEEKTSPVKILIAGGFTKGDLRYAGQLIAKAKKDKVITTCNGRPRARFYKFV